MTTIAYKAGVLAGDTRVTSGKNQINPGHATKVFQLPDGSLLGVAGDVVDCQQLIDALMDQRAIPRLKRCEAILVMTDGSIHSFEGSNSSAVEGTDYWACGSGWIPACVAMRCGKSAEEAVKIAMEFDASSGGEVRTVQLEPQLKKKKPRKRAKR